MTAPFFKILLRAAIIGALMQPMAWAGTVSEKPAPLIKVSEMAWLPDPKVISYEIRRMESGKAPRYELKVLRAKREVRSAVISGHQYAWFRDKMFGLLLNRQARMPASAACQERFRVQLQELKETASICAGDYRDYFQVKAMLLELVQAGSPR